MADKNTKSNKTEFFEKWWFYLIIVGVIFLTWAASAFFLVHASFDNTNGDIWTIRGTFGDMFGAVNALFSGLAFGGMIVTLLMQRKELKLQREELTKTTNELEGQKKIMEMQQKVANIQCFENGFYKLISKHTEIVNDIRYYHYRPDGSEKKYFGQEALDCMFWKISSEEDKIDFLKSKDPWAAIKNSVLKPYFTQFYEIIRNIDESDLLDDNYRKNYIRILISFLTETELKLIFLKALYPGQEKFKNLIEKYSFFRNLTDETRAKLEGLSEIKSNYEESAFSA